MVHVSASLKKPETRFETMCGIERKTKEKVPREKTHGEGKDQQYRKNAKQ